MTSFAPLALQLVKAEWADTVPSPAHDAMDAQQRRAYRERHPLSYLRVTRSPEDAALDGSDRAADALLAQGRRALEELLTAGVFGTIQPARYYVYRLTRDERSQTGLVGGIAVADYRSRELRLHERIQPDRAGHLARHLSVVGVQSSPITAAHRPLRAVSEIAGAVTVDAPTLVARGDDGLTQEIWSVEHREHEHLVREILADTPTYLIDGHHRAAAAEIHQAEEAGGGPADWLLSALFPTDQLHNHGFHRILRDVDLARFREAAAATGAELRPIEGPEHRDLDELAVYGREHGAARWAALRLPMTAGTGPSATIDNLDAVRLDRQLLGPALGLDAEQSGSDILYRPGSLGLDALVASADDANGVLCVTRPVPVAVIIDAADDGLLMPPKSTYFEPKTRSGVFLRSVSDRVQL